MEARYSRPSRAVTENGEESWSSQFTRYQNYQKDWMEQTRGSLMLVATFIATMTFQIAINPPGGVWQSDSDAHQGCAAGKMCKAGTSVLAFGGSNQKLNYELFILLSTISFTASQAIILLLICGFSLSKRWVLWFLIIAMCISIYCTAGAYVTSIRMVMDPVNKTVNSISMYYTFYWAGLIVLLCLVLLGRFLFWVLKKVLAAARGKI